MTTRKKSQVDHPLVIATSLQEASTWINQAAIALEKLEPTGVRDKELATLAAVANRLVIIHNRYSRVKMSGG